MATRLVFQQVSEPATPQLNGPVDLSDPSSVRNCVAEPKCAAELAGYFGIPAASHIHSLIAMVPDPMHSRLSLLTDSSIQAIEDAAQASGWIVAGQWMPWLDSADPDEKDPEKRREEREYIRRQEKQPGILVFRQSAREDEKTFRDDVALVFLVGESTTAGVNPAQFQLARAYMRAPGEPKGPVRILGPVFSGSFYSLAALLKDDRVQSGATAYRVRSGTATNTYDGSILQRIADFRGTSTNTTDQSWYFRSTLADLGIDPADAALLVEDDSAYGNDTVVVARKNAEPRGTAQLKDIRVFRFPRDISHLRNAYQGAAAASKTNSSKTSDVEFSIKDPQTGEESTPIFSGSQSPLSQDGVINRITEAIQRDGIRLVEVNATNVLDMLFLANVLRRQCPDTRLLVTFPDVLLVEAAQTEPLAGTLVLTSYPSFFASNAWMGGRQKIQPVTFPDANSEGVYNAAILLLNDDSHASGLLADYHWGELEHPPTWLLTLGHQGFLPVDVFDNEKDARSQKNTWFHDVKPPSGGTVVLPSPPRSWNFTSMFIALTGIAISLWTLWISFNPNCEMDARFSFLRIDSESSWRRFYILFFLVVILLMEITMSIPALRAEQPVQFIGIPVLSCTCVVIACWHVLGSLTPGGGAKWAARAGMAAAAAAIAPWLTSCYYGNDRSLFFAFRALELRFGSSPTWPILTAFSALALFGYVHLTRLYFSACQEPDVVTDGLPTNLQQRMHAAWQNFNGVLKSDFGFWQSAGARSFPWWKLVATAAVLVSAVFRVDLKTRSLDGPGYSWLAFVLELIVVILLLLTCEHIQSLWRSLEIFLSSLDMLPLASSFKPTDGAGTDRPIWVRRLNLQSLDIHVEAIYVLRNMTVLAKDGLALSPTHHAYVTAIKTKSEIYGSLIENLLNVGDERTRDEMLTRMKTVRHINKSIAEDAFQFLRDYWKDHTISRSGAPEAGGEGGTKQGQAEGDPVDRMAVLAQRFVALHYSSFILYSVRQIQNFFLFLSGGFVLLMISLNCYSVQAPQFVGRLLIVLFLVVGASTLTCLIGLERNPVLSRIAGGDPGKLNTGFYLKIAGYGGLPLISLLASQFPSISSFLLSWVEPTLEAFK